MDLADLASLEPLAGGWSGETFAGEAAGERCVVRVYGGRGAARGAQAPEVDAAVMALVRGLVPVPEVLEVRRADEAAGTPGLLVTAWVDGERGDLLLTRLDDDGRRAVGRALGEVAALLAGMPQRRLGPFLDGELRVGSWGDLDLPGWVDQHLPVLVGWSEREREALLAVALAADERLSLAGRTSLVHSDLNAKNVLLHPDRLEVTAVLDWEFAHAGHPLTDLGNVLRHERGAGPRPLLEGALEAWLHRRGGERHDVLAAARAADLWALVELAARDAGPGRSPVTTEAHRLLRAVAREGDPGAA